MNCTKESCDQAKRLYSDTHDLLRYLVSKKNTHIPGCVSV